METPQGYSTDNTSELLERIESSLPFALVVRRQPDTESWIRVAETIIKKGPMDIRPPGEGPAAFSAGILTAVSSSGDEESLIAVLTDATAGAGTGLEPERFRKDLSDVLDHYRVLKPAASFTMMKNFAVRVSEEVYGHMSRFGSGAATLVMAGEIKLRQLMAAVLLCRQGHWALLLDAAPKPIAPALETMGSLVFWEPSGTPVQSEGLLTQLWDIQRRNESHKALVQQAERAYVVHRELPRDPFRDYLQPMDSRPGYVSGEWPVITAYSTCLVGVPEDLNDYYNRLFELRESFSQTPDRFVFYNGQIPLGSEPDILSVAAAAAADGNYGPQDALQYLWALDGRGGFRFLDDDRLKATFILQLEQLAEAYLTIHSGTFSTLKNFLVKLIVWARPVLQKQAAVLKSVRARQNGISGLRVMYYGEAKEHEALFLMLLPGLGIDVLYVNSKHEAPFDVLDKEGQWLNKLVLPQRYPVQPFPDKLVHTRTTTVAGRASEELEQLIYSDDAGVIRPWQYDGYGVETVSLHTTYEELKILWKQDARFREGFRIQNRKVYVPNLFAKVSGVQEHIEDYWRDVHQFLEVPTHFFAGRLPIVSWTVTGSDMYFAGTMLHQNTIDRNRLQGSSLYKLHHLKTTTQQLILDTVEETLGSPLFLHPLTQEEKARGLVMLLNMDSRLLNLLHGFDKPFTVPKVVVYSNDEAPMGLDDAVLLVFVQMLGMDTVLLTPTGYNNLERWIQPKFFDTFKLDTVAFGLPFREHREEKKSFLASLFGMKL